MIRPPRRPSRDTSPGAGLAVRLVVATVCAIAVLATAPRGATPGGGAWPGIVAGPPIVAAASPEPSAPGTDTRSPGEGPGLVGAPFLAIVGVLALGLVTAGGTLVYLRLSAGPGGRATGAGERRGSGGAKPRG